MQIVPIHHWHAKNRIPWIPLHCVSGPWTSIVAALDGGRSNIAVCRRYSQSLLIIDRVYCQMIKVDWLTAGVLLRELAHCLQILPANEKLGLEAGEIYQTLLSADQ